MRQSCEKPLRIAYVIGQLGYGGAERQLYECVSNLDPEQFSPRVYSLSPELHPYGIALRRAGVPVVGLRRRGRADVMRVLLLGRLLKSQDPQVVHSFLAMDGITAAMACRWFVPSALRVLSARCVSVKRDWVREMLIGLSYRAADVVVCNAREVARFLVASYGVDAGRVRVVYNGIRAGEFSSSRAKGLTETGRTAGVKRRGQVVAMVARLEPPKNAELFVRASAVLAFRHPELKFLLVGDGSSRAGLERMSRDLNIADRLGFTGMRDDIPELLAGVDMLVHTSNHEGFSNSILEAMAAGLPVVVTDVGGARELVRDGENGLLVPPGNLEAVVRGVERILSDARLAGRLGRRAAEHVKSRFSVSRMVQDMTEVYHRGLGVPAAGVEPAVAALGG